MFYAQQQFIQSPLEEMFLDMCCVVGLCVVPQYKVGPIHCDFAIPTQHLAIEIDSKEYHSTDDQKANDERRNDIYNENGWKVLRIHSHAIYKNGEEVVYRIRNKRYGNQKVEYISDIKKEEEY